MEITLTPDQEVLIRQAVESGRYGCPEDAVAEALRLWERLELQRAQFLASLDAAEASLNGEDSVTVTQESMRALAEEVKRFGREDLPKRRHFHRRRQRVRR